MKKIGFIVNPIAGIGGKVGLKGSDGAETLKRALTLGAVPESGKKAVTAMKELAEVQNIFELYTYPDEMGANVCEEAGLGYRELGEITSGHTTAADTRIAAEKLKESGVNLLVFVGGDGTARDIMDAVGTDIPVLGIPAGCKIHSGVYALNPKTAGKLLREYVEEKVRETIEAEVMDINEELFRQGIVEAQLYGYLQIPRETKMVQHLKSGRRYSESESVDMLSSYIADIWEPDTLYIVGTGSTTAAIMKKMGLPNTLLGVDLVWKKKVIASDCTEKQILNVLKSGKYNNIKIIVTVIGGQGYIFGRGNQQISADVIRMVGRENIIVAASKDKMLSLFGKPLYVDTGNEEINELLSGYIRVVVGYEETYVAKIM